MWIFLYRFKALINIDNPKVDSEIIICGNKVREFEDNEHVLR